MGKNARSPQRPPKAHVFLSHSSEDARTANLLREALETEDIPCWIAPRNVIPGQEYGEAIIDALKRSRVFVLVFGSNSERSPHIRSEIERAASLDIPVIVFRTDSTQPSDGTGFFLGRHHWLDGSNGPPQVCAAMLVDAVRRLFLEPSTNAKKADAVRHPGADREPVPKRKTAASGRERRLTAIGIDIGGSKIRGCLVEFPTDENPVVCSNNYLLDVKHPISARSVVEQVKSIIQNIYAGESLESAPPIGIGIAAAGQVDLRAGVLKFAPALGLRNLSLKSIIASAYPGIDVRVDNDVRCATRCELYLGPGRDFDSFVCIFVGTGVGSGVAIDGRILFGSNYCAGEIGHSKIASDGPTCNCGQTGCLESFVNAPALADRARAKAVEWKSRGIDTELSDVAGQNTPRTVAAALEAGDPAAQEVADEIGKKLGIGIANYLNILNPGAVLLGGGLMSGFFMHMSNGIFRGIQSSALSDVANTPIVHSRFSDDGAALGAALLFHPKSPWPF